MPPCLTQLYKVRIKGKWSNPGKRIEPSPTHPCSSYWKGSPRVTLDYGRPTYYYVRFFYFRSYCIFFSSSLFDYRFQFISFIILDLFNMLLQPNICTTSLRCYILQNSSLPMILTSSHKGRGFAFFFPDIKSHTRLFDHASSYCFSMFL